MRSTLFIAFLLFVILFLFSCGGSDGGIQVEEVTRVVEVTKLVESVGETNEVEITKVVDVPIEVEVTRVVEVTRLVEQIVVATPTLEPIPEVFVELAGNGDIVTENYSWGECSKAVFYWTAAGRDNMIVALHQVGTDEYESLVNEIGPGEGQALQPFSAGTYYFAVTGPLEGWTIRGECQDPSVVTDESVASGGVGEPENYLASLLPNPDQFPAGLQDMQFANSKTTTSQDIANNDDDPATRLEALIRAGRILGYADVYRSETYCDTREGPYELSMQTILYESAAGANQEYSDAASDYSSYSDTVFQFVDIGDQGFYYLYSDLYPFDEFPLECGDPGDGYRYFAMLFTRDNVMSFTQILADDVDEQILVSLTTDLAQIIDDNIRVTGES